MGTLHIVSTPIGNLDDITMRALEVLRTASILLAEDTRQTKKLLDRHNISTRMLSFHKHNEVSREEKVLLALSEKVQVALVCDGGTPLISDPGERLVRVVLQAGHDVIAVPGPSAVLAALVTSGLPASSFTFVGFLPRKEGLRKRKLETLSSRSETLVFYESPRRLVKTLNELYKTFGDREACVARELTKIYEEKLTGNLRELADQLRGEVKGEVTIVVKGASQRSIFSSEEVDSEIASGLASGRSSRDLADDLASRSGWSRRLIYARIVAMR